MISVVIPYHKNKDGLAVTLVSLQSQVVPPDLIVVIDTSKDQSGLELVRRYSTHDVPIVVESANCSIYQAWNKGIELSGGGADVLIINDDVLLPQNTIDIMLGIRERVQPLVLVPNTPPKTHAAPSVTEPFEWYTDVDAHVSITEWMPGFCFLLTAECIKQVGLFDETFQVWYGDDDYQRRVLALGEEDEFWSRGAAEPTPIVRIDSLYAYHFGGSSFNYKNPIIKQKISKDRTYFEEKYGAVVE